MQLNESSHFQWLQLIDSILERWKFIIRENYKNAPNLVIHDDHLTHFSPVLHFYTPWKRQKTKGFLTFSGGKEMWHWTKMG